MFTTLTGAVLYVLALFPGVAFVFAREGHRPMGKRSPLRELAGIVLVSAVCNAVVGLIVLGTAVAVAPLRNALNNVVAGNAAYTATHYGALFLGGLAGVLCATVLGWWLGGELAARLGVDRIVRSRIDRDSSGWGVAFSLGNGGKNKPPVAVLVGAQLKSGMWIQGQLHTFNNAGDGEPGRSIVLVGELKYHFSGTAELREVDGFGAVVFDSDDVEYLLVGYREVNLAAEKSPGADGRF